jgi:hypothetical protein
MAQNQVAVRTRREEVKVWLRSVQHYREAFGYDIRSAVGGTNLSFPDNWILQLTVVTAKAWARKYVRYEIRAASTSLGVTLNNEELDLLADAAVAALGS